MDDSTKMIKVIIDISKHDFEDLQRYYKHEPDSCDFYETTIAKGTIYKEDTVNNIE